MNHDGTGSSATTLLQRCGRQHQGSGHFVAWPAQAQLRLQTCAAQTCRPLLLWSGCTGTVGPRPSKPNPYLCVSCHEWALGDVRCCNNKLLEVLALGQRSHSCKLAPQMSCPPGELARGRARYQPHCKPAQVIYTLLCADPVEYSVALNKCCLQ